MKVVIQRVSRASCKVDNEIINAINKGYLLLVGFTEGDNIDNVKQMAQKIANLRIFEDENNKLNLNIMDAQGDILSISQFTLYGDTRKGNRPSFTKALDPAIAERLYYEFNQILNDTYHITTKAGVFGAHMEIELVNDGPVTIILEY
ncbi:MAG TPA: D-tyrosyl-tRNA(Tyr) deacylase [Acholeplasmataceae bacterium]|nr:D-tyrosyl-tRNA(Tyr) deacylase [Acholeplasmataceae bacterium]